MSDKKLYRVLAQTVNAWRTCCETRNQEWQEKHYERVNKLVKEFLPSGSGFDNGTGVSWERTTDDCLVFRVGYHHMDEHGSYDGWTNHDVIVKPSLVFGFTVRVTGVNKNDIKDYIAEVFIDALNTEVTE